MLRIVLFLAAVVVGQNDSWRQIITLLENMVAKNKATQKDQETKFKEADCWCTQTKDKLNGDIAKLSGEIEDLETSIDTNMADAATARENKESHFNEAEQAKSMLESATEQRRQELNRFQVEEQELVDTSAAVKQAMDILMDVTEHTETQGLRKKTQSFLQVRAKLQKIASNPSPYMSTLQRDILEIMKVFPQKPKLALAQATEPKMNEVVEAKNSQGNMIVGMLETIRDQCKADLNILRKEESERKSAFEVLSANTQKRIEDNEEGFAQEKRTQKAEEMQVQHEKKVLKMQNRRLDGQKEELSATEKKCVENEEQHKQNMADNADEAKALAFLYGEMKSDRMRNQFSKTQGTAFVQFSSHSSSKATRSHAMKILRKAMLNGASPSLLSIATELKAGKFDKVIATCEKYHSDLKDQQKVDDKLWNNCRDEKHSNEMSTQQNGFDREMNQSAQDKSQKQIDQLNKSLNQLKVDHHDALIEMKKLTNMNKKNNKDFVRNQGNCAATLNGIGIMMKMVNKYMQGSGQLDFEKTALVQQAPIEGPKVEARQNNAMWHELKYTFEKVEMDVKHEQKKNLENFQTQVNEYASDMNNYREQIDDLMKAQVQTMDSKTQEEDNLLELKKTGQALFSTAEELNNFANNLHKQCNFIVNNYDLRKENRQQEMDMVFQVQNMLREHERNLA